MIRALTRGQAWGIADMPISATRDVRDTLAAVAELDDRGCSRRAEPYAQRRNRADIHAVARPGPTRRALDRRRMDENLDLTVRRAVRA